MTIVLLLPMPPSTNRLWRSTRRGMVYKESKAKSWCEHAAWSVAQQRKGVLLKGYVAVMLEVEYRETGDLDNKIKATLDMLQQGGLLLDDRQVMSLTAMWSQEVTGVRVTVEETKMVLRPRTKGKLKRRELCPACGNAFDPRGRPTCDCPEETPIVEAKGKRAA